MRPKTSAAISVARPGGAPKPDRVLRRLELGQKARCSPGGVCGFSARDIGQPPASVACGSRKRRAQLALYGCDGKNDLWHRMPRQNIVQRAKRSAGLRQSLSSGSISKKRDLHRCGPSNPCRRKDAGKSLTSTHQCSVCWRPTRYSASACTEHLTVRGWVFTELRTQLHTSAPEPSPISVGPVLSRR